MPTDMPMFADTRSFQIIAAILLYVVTINLWAFLLFAIDKHRARRGNWRLPEHRLLFAAFLGGTIGAYLARRVLRHKTVKEPFGARLRAIARFQVVASVLGVVAWTQPGIWAWMGVQMVRVADLIRLVV